MNRKHSGSIILAILLVASASFVGAVPTADTETTQSAETSDLVDGTSIANFNASSKRSSMLAINVSTDDPGLMVIDPMTNETMLTRSSSAFTQTYSDATNNTYHFKLNFSHDEFAALPMEAGENKTFTFRILGNESNDSGPMTDLSIMFNNTNERTVLRVGDTLADSNDVETTSDTKYPFGFGDEFNVSTVDFSSASVDGKTTDIYLVFANETVASSYDNSLDAGWGSLESGDLLSKQQVLVEDTPIAVFNAEPPEVFQDSIATYGVWEDNVGGEKAIRVELGDHYEDDDALDVSSTGGEGYGVLDSLKFRMAAANVPGFAPAEA